MIVRSVGFDVGVAMGGADVGAALDVAVGGGTVTGVHESQTATRMPSPRFRPTARAE